MFSREQFAEDARELARTHVPFRNQGSDPSVGLDCINLLRVLYEKQGLTLPDEMERAFKSYHPKTNGKEMFRLMLKWLIPIEIHDARIGDVYLFRDKTDTRHTAVRVSDDEPPFIVEAHIHKVLYSKLDFLRSRLIVAAFRIPDGSGINTISN